MESIPFFSLRLVISARTDVRKLKFPSPRMFLSLSLASSPAIGRTLIPRYFSSLFEGGVYELFFELKQTKESFNNSTITVDSHHCTMATQHGKPTFTKVLHTHARVWLSESLLAHFEH